MPRCDIICYDTCSKWCTPWRSTYTCLRSSCELYGIMLRADT